MPDYARKGAGAQVTDLDQAIRLDDELDERPRPIAPRPRPAPHLSATGRPARWIPLLGVVEAAFAQRRLMILMPFAMVVGNVIYVAVTIEPQPWLLAPVAAALALMLVLTQAAPKWFRLLALVLGVWTGFGLLPIHGMLVGTPMLDRPVFGTYRMTIDEVVSEEAGKLRVLVSQVEAVGDARALDVRRARLVVSGLSVAPGDRIEGKVRFYNVPAPILPNGFDTQFHAYFDGIGAYGNTTSAPVKLTTSEGAAPQRLVDGIRRGIAARLDSALAPATAGIARALITGDQSDITDADREVLGVAGLAHVYSVSGLHLTIVAGLVLASLRGGLALLPGSGRRVSTKKLAAVGAILAALGYYAISGGNVAALRSTLMILLVLGAIVAGRRALTMRNVALAALVIIVTDPASVLRPSFQLSFAAVVGLIGAWEMLADRVRERDRRWPERIGAYLLGSVATSVVAGAATLLFSVYYFQQTSPLGVLGNLLALPLVSFVMMPAALLATLAMPLGLDTPFVMLLGWSVDRMMDIAHMIAGWSGGLGWSPLLAPSALLIGLAAFAWYAFFPRWHRLIGPAIALPVILLFATDRPPDVLVADTTQAVAMRGSGGLELIAGKGTSFAVGVWRETYAEAIADAGGTVGCDKGGCFATSPLGFAVALPRTSAALHEDCADSQLMVIRTRIAADCPGALVITAPDLERLGTHWLAWTPASRTFEVRTAIDAAPRPWRPATR